MMPLCEKLNIFNRKECSVNEDKASGEYNKINDGMKEVNTKMEAITTAMKEKGKDHKHILK